jgi:hypothetical protein
MLTTQFTQNIDELQPEDALWHLERQIVLTHKHDKMDELGRLLTTLDCSDSTNVVQADTDFWPEAISAYIQGEKKQIDWINFDEIFEWYSRIIDLISDKNWCVTKILQVSSTTLDTLPPISVLLQKRAEVSPYNWQGIPEFENAYSEIAQKIKLYDKYERLKQRAQRILSLLDSEGDIGDEQHHQYLTINRLHKRFLNVLPDTFVVGWNPQRINKDTFWESLNWPKEVKMEEAA